jgi:molybdenum cofactor synthesis domain-containing protein
LKIDIGILTVSDRASRGEYKDKSGPMMARLIGDHTQWRITHKTIVGDDLDSIKSILFSWCDQGVALILTTGGTGFAPRDLTPEATRLVIEREAPGIAEALRSESMKITKHALLSRAIAGIRGKTLIINLPGSPKAVKENLLFLFPVLPHALELISGTAGSEAGHRTV